MRIKKKDDFLCDPKRISRTIHAEVVCAAAVNRNLVVLRRPDHAFLSVPISLDIGTKLCLLSYVCSGSDRLTWGCASVIFNEPSLNTVMITNNMNIGVTDSRARAIHVRCRVGEPK